MQDRYAGDIGDFSKFSLLKALNAAQLGIVWYRYPDESHNSDGHHTHYLNQQPYRQCDAALCNSMQRVTESRERSIAALEQTVTDYLPAGTRYFGELCHFHKQYPGQARAAQSAREQARVEWLQRALEVVEGCDVVCLDPDNGLEVASCSKLSQSKAGKYAFLHEIEAFAKRHDLVVLYQHLSRQGSHQQQIRERVDQLEQRLGRGYEVSSIHFRRYSARAYLLIGKQGKMEAYRQRIDAYLEGCCGFMWK